MKNIIFDIGNVLIKWDPNPVYLEYFEHNLAKMQDFYNQTNIFTVNSELDRGVSFKQALTQLANEFPHYHEPIHMWQNRWLETIGGSIHASVTLLTSLHAKQYPLYALTNFAEETFFTHIRHDAKYNFLNLFTDIVVSGVEKVIKPNPKIYEILLQRNNLDPKNCIYIDDSKANLAPAQELGMTTIHFTSSKELADELCSLNISI